MAPHGDPVRVVDHCFVSGPNVEQTIPYGVYDLTTDAGWLNVGVDHDTAAFAVASIRRWWQARGTADYPHASRLLITADVGGSNSNRYRLWKAELAALATETGLAITVCHFPPGTSKWNKIEHRLFSQITMNWLCQPLTSHDWANSSNASPFGKPPWPKSPLRPTRRRTDARGPRRNLPLCTRAVLAELFQVSPRTIGNALLAVRPLLEQDGNTPVPAPIRYRTAAPLLAAIPQQEGDTPESTPYSHTIRQT